ncbi:lipid storage droplets surface-binding protein 1 isoform X2 [Phymastichus coffea]|uniref:lipid storage droplets surface-binding protein 1 isoform X2 n=1 Tax=Phymastichus coffea TaxID=108790 RepID=UPI00273A96C5|nr:lipid storage droplets surface-binding protein 1 isoform X2 [Phymastichus coffea]
MARPNIIKRRHTELQLESVARISNLPIVESGINIAGNVYRRIKRSNSLIDWGLDTAETSLASAMATATATALPAMIVLNGPIMTIDHLLCKGIDMVEQRVPAIHLPPHLMYWNTREYVNNKFVKPVLIRADSVKLIGSQAANAAVDRLNGAIDVADQYVDRYLPADPADKSAEDCTDSAKPEETGNKAVRTIEHGARFSRKLQRRLTRRTLAEARALKEQGTECIHVLLYVVELIATDPKLAWQKAKELWTSLSLPEPENQARPTNLEQLLVLFTRETARRIVHLVNGTANLASRAPRRLGRTLIRIYHQLITISEQALKVTSRSIYRILVDVLSATSSYRQHLIAISDSRQSCDRPRRKLHFQTNGVCATGNKCNVGAGIDGNGFTGNYLSLIAKINIVSLPRIHTKSSLSSFIEELSPEDDDEDANAIEVKDNDTNEANEANAGSKFFLNAKNNGAMIPSVFKKPVRKIPVKTSIAYNGESILPVKVNSNVDKRMPLFTKIKPLPIIRQQQ